MKNIFFGVILLCPFIVTAETEITWTGFGGQTSMTGSVTGDRAGFSVAISSDGTIVAVGEPLWDGVGSASGRVRTYRLQNGIWTEFGGATSMTGAVGNDQAGTSVAINFDGTIVAVGEPFWNGVGSNSGRVRTYSLSGGVWTQFGGATSMTGTVTDDNAGASLAINADGTIIAVGEPNWDASGGNVGRVRTYILQNGVWTNFGGETSMAGAAAADQAGFSVAISSDGAIVAVGEPFWDGVGGNSGRVRTYSLQNGVWTQFGGATSMTGEAADDTAGRSVAINSKGTIVAVSENGWSGSRGRVRTYILQNDTWTQFGGATSMTGQVAGDQLFTSVAINADGAIVAVGEASWDGVDASSGRVRTYKLQNGTWTEFGGATSMTGAAVDDQAGRSLAMSSNGTIIAVGEPLWDGVGSASGRVRTYFYPSTDDNIPTEDRIRNSELAHTCYLDISQGTYTDHATNPGGVGQGAWFTPYRITVQGR